MRQLLLVLVTALVCGCQSLPIGRATNESADALARLDGVLAGQYDNYEQVRQVAVKVEAGNVIAVPHLHEEWRALSQNHGGSLWLWRLQSLDPANATEAVWLYLISAANNGSGVVLTPYRAIDPNAAKTAFSDTQGKFKFVAEQWAELAPCALTGAWNGSQFSASANTAACSA